MVARSPMSGSSPGMSGERAARQCQGQGKDIRRTQSYLRALVAEPWGGRAWQWTGTPRSAPILSPLSVSDGFDPGLANREGWNTLVYGLGPTGRSQGVLELHPVS